MFELNSTENIALELTLVSWNSGLATRLAPKLYSEELNSDEAETAETNAEKNAIFRTLISISMDVLINKLIENDFEMMGNKYKVLIRIVILRRRM